MTATLYTVERTTPAYGNFPVPAFLEEFDLQARKAIVVAVSGGSDSTALLLLTRAWRDRVAPSLRILAATVDHGLRTESAKEAAAVATLCAQLGIDHVTLRWTGEKPSTGVQATARAARLRLLATAARDAGTDLVLLGHTLDDQAETVAMRAERGPGIGLAGMAPATLVDGTVWFVRPLLTARRDDLRAFLRERGIAWIDDPSNDNPAFERVRMRLSKPAIAPERIEEAARERSNLASGAAALLDRHAATPSRGLVRLDPAFFGAEDRDAAIHALRALLAAVGGVERLPDTGRTYLLFDRARPSFRATLSRALVDARRDGVFLLREGRGLPAPCAAVDGMEWDGRFRLSGDVPIGAVVAPAGRTAEVVGETAAPASLVRAALAVEPALERGQSLAPAMLHTHSQPVAAFRLALPWSRLLPSFDVPLANAVARAIGAGPFPQPPFHGHKGAKA